MPVLVVPGVAKPLPYAPTLLSPANGTYEDLSGEVEFSWQYNGAQVGLTQTNFLFAQMIAGAAIPMYWNGSGWQTTEPSSWPSNTEGDYLFPDNSFENGNTYQWAVATQDANGQGPLSGYWTVTGEAVPVVTSISPAGTIITASPTISWTASYGTSEIAYRVAIYDAATYNAPGFVPGGTTSPDPNAVYDTGVVGSTSGNSLNLGLIPVYLQNGTQYRFYVQVTQLGGQTSAWAYSSVTCSFYAPKTPTITATVGTDPDTGCPLVELDVQAHDNLLSNADSISPVGSGTGTWVAGTDTTLGSGTSPGSIYSLKLTATAAHNLTASTATGLSGYAVEENTEYSAIATVQANTTGRTCTVAIEWYDDDGDYLSTSTGDSFSDATATQGSVTDTSPAGAAYAAILITVESAADDEIHWFGQAALLLGDDTTWGIGGFVGRGDVMILRSDGLWVRYASISNPAEIPADTQAVTVYDYEAVPYVSYTYSAQVIVVVTSSQTVLSSAGVSDAATVETTQWWELDPTDYSTAIAVQPIAWTPVQVEQSTAHMVSGTTSMYVVANTLLGQDFNATFQTFDNETYASLAGTGGSPGLLNSQKTLFVSSPWGATDSGYFRMGPQSGGMSSGTGNTTKSTTLTPSVYSGGVRTIAVTAINQLRPAV